MSSDRILGDILVENALITDEQLEEALSKQSETGQLLEDILIAMSYVAERDVLDCLGVQFGMDVVSIVNVDIPGEVLDIIEEPMIRAYNIIPIRKRGDVLTIATSNPFNTTVLDDIKFMLDCEIRAVLCSKNEIINKVIDCYGAEGSSISNLIGKISGELSMAEEAIDDQDKAALEKLANDAPVVKLLNLILIQAAKDNASDIHLEPFESEFKVRYRVDGALYEMVPPPKHLALAITSRVKIMANLDISERRLPQDGRIQINMEGRNIELRVSTLPTAFGESVVMRILDKSNTTIDLEKLGMPDKLLANIRSIIHRPNGIFVVTGPTGSGKTTTLYSCLKELNTIENKIITTEDPVEYDLDGIMQIPIADGIGLTFARCLRAILRQDPDQIMVGEIRDKETAEIAIQASLTGHLVVSTLHTNDSLGSITRLVDMGVQPYLIVSTMQAVLAQRLVRRICQTCKEPYEVTREHMIKADLEMQGLEGKTFYYGKGCKACNNSGYKGRLGIYEMLEMTEGLREAVMAGKSSTQLKEVAKELGLITLEEDGVAKMLKGLTSLEEVARET